MSDVLTLLPPFEWRGKKYPVTSRSVSFAHESVQHKLQYRDGEIVEQTGARNPTFSYTIPMREDIARGPYKHLFSEGLPSLFRDMRLRDQGPLTDPIYGHFTCVPTSFTEDSDPQKRDGVDVRVEFLLSPEVDEDDQIQPPTLQDMVGEAGALDEEIKRVDWKQEPPPEGTTDILSAINGALFAGQRAQEKVAASLHDVAFRCEKIEGTVDKLTDPKNWPLRAATRRLRDTALRVAGGDSPGQRRAPVRTRHRMPLSAVAASVGLTVEQLLILNPQLAASPMVPAGTEIRVPARG